MALTGTSKACTFSDVVPGSFKTTWMSRHPALTVIVVGQPLLGRLTTVLMHFVFTHIIFV